MTRLVIEYVMEGHQRGYNFTSPTGWLDDAALKTIWRGAMPRGQGWNAPLYQGARSLKCFPLDDGRVAASQVTVTDRRDENGRGGIRRAEIEVLRRADYMDYLKERQRRLPSLVLGQIAHKPSLWQSQQIINRTLPRCWGREQMVLAHPYTGANDALVFEALALKLALSPLLAMKRVGRVISFTSLALEYREESLIVILPAERASQLNGAGVIDLR